MLKPYRCASLLLFTTALVTPALVSAQVSTETQPEQEAVDPAAEVAPAEADPSVAEGTDQTTDATQAEEETEISVPGGEEIVVRGFRDRNIAKTSAQVVSVLSSADIARTGEGNIAGALGRVTGLSVVGSGYVYVRGLGDRYSLALLNGSPLPSPEPLRRVVPLDLFPTGVIASSLVQKSYSANYPGEFGGGVINLTTKATPRDPFFTIGGSISGDGETTGHLGYTYFGGGSDWTGYTNSNRNPTPALSAFLSSGERLSQGNVDLQEVGKGIFTGQNAIVQRDGNLPPNASISFSGGKTFDVGTSQLGIIAGGGYSNRYLTRDSIQQRSLSADVSTADSDFREVNTDQRIVVNGLLGLGFEFGENKLRWTNLYIHDTIKQARLSLGNLDQTSADILRQKTAWYERQLINTQLVAEFDITSDLDIDFRAAYAESQREAPYELSTEYVRTNSAADPTGEFFVNILNRQRGDARVIFSDLKEELLSGGVDVTYQLTPDIGITVGNAYSDTNRVSSRREFFYDANGLPSGVGLLRADLLLGPQVIDLFNISLLEADEGNPAFEAKLRTWAAYGKTNIQIGDTINIDAGVRWEKADQSVEPIQVFNTPGASGASTALLREYWLPAATVTFDVTSEIKFRVSASKTIARPQFRELINQPYFDPESNRAYRGNPLLVDSQLLNGEARVEYYFAPEQRLSIAGFYKKIDNPIEAFVSPDFTTSYANAPEATLFGVEIDAQKYFDLSTISSSDFFATRRLVLIANYTFTKSELKVAAGDTTAVFGAFSTNATDFFQDGSPLTGQSDHIVNLQIGIEDQDKLSQQTLLLSYSTDRVSSRGINGTPPQPDVIERPGFRLDLVAREGIKIAGQEAEFKFELRNITRTKFREFQKSGDNIIIYNQYDRGLSASASLSFNF
ncbi:TonB-dependent receptor domain-containing protein [Sphingorhabdus sp.]|uniref:TonB-dependent receptor domain-containing protein n=1 Tax=Sphingorhabdus sp. TaxID=1902408 RepID=UPI0035934EDC